MRILFNDNWFFVEEKKPFKKIKPYDNNFPEKNLTSVSIPDDRSIIKNFNDKSPGKNEAGLLDGGIFWYVKKFNIPKEDEKGLILMQFEGVYMNSEYYINGTKIANHPNGYTPFTYDITKYINFGGENLVALRVENIQPSSRWYSGTGIYRDVYLLKYPNTHIPVYGNTIKTPRLMQTTKSNNIRCDITTEVFNKGNISQNFKVKVSLLDFNKEKVLKEELFDKIHTIEEGKKLTLENTIYVSDIKLWSVENPNLYYFLIELLDEEGNSFFKDYVRYGFRYMNFNKDGFLLNGEYLKLRGVCEHHDHGILGSKSLSEAIIRKIKILKDMGVNAIRSSHNMACSKLIYYADKMGMLIIDEAFDAWYQPKKEYDYGRFFKEISNHPEANGVTNAEWDLMTMINRDKNSPSVFMYSIGNEIDVTHKPDDEALRVAKMLVETIKKIDTTRPVTLGQNGYERPYDESIHRISSYLDVVGLNYAENFFNKIQSEKPNFVLFGSETSSAVKSRGVYIDPKGQYNINVSAEENKINRNAYTLNAYGTDRVGWGKTANDVLLFDERNKEYLGQFIWTGFDYIGEPTPWHNHYKTPPKSSFFGVIDTCGYPKDDYYLFKSVWVSHEKEPFVHFLPHWNFNESDLKVLNKYGTKIDPTKIPFRVYTNLFGAEVFINSQSYGRLTFETEKVGDNIIRTKNGLTFLEWIIPYNENATVKVVGYDKKNNPVIARELRKIGDPVKVALEKDKYYEEGENNIHYINYFTVDSENKPNPVSDSLIEFELIGNGIIIGTDNGNPGNRVPYQVNTNKTSNTCFMGKGLIIVKKFSNDPVTLIAKSKKLEQAEMTF